MKSYSQARKTKSGNALWFILLAVFLLAALAVILTRASSNTEERGDSERVRIEAMKLTRFTSAVQASVQRMLQNGISESEVSFTNDLYEKCDNTPNTPSGTNPNCTSAECEVFNVRGGGVKPIETPDKLYDSPYTCLVFKRGMVGFKVIDILKVGTTAQDLVLEVYWLNKEACMELNRLSGVDNPGGNPPEENETTFCSWTGNYSCATEVFGDDAPEVAGKKNFCTYRASDDAYFFHSVLIAR